MKKIFFLFVVLALFGCENPNLPKPKETVPEVIAPVVETPAPAPVVPEIVTPEPVETLPEVVEPVVTPEQIPAPVTPPVVVEVPPVVVEPPPVVVEPVKGLYVYNSAWERQTGIEALYSAKLSSRAISTMSIDDYIAKKNKETKDDQLFVFDKEVPIKEAPEAFAYIVEPVTHDPLMIFTEVPRADFKDRKAIWDAQTYSMGGILFIDNIPEPPAPVIDTRTDFEKYACYLIDPDGVIVYEMHCQDWEAEGFTSMIANFEWARSAYSGQAYANGPGWTAVIGSIYPIPE